MNLGTLLWLFLGCQVAGGRSLPFDPCYFEDSNGLERCAPHFRHIAEIACETSLPAAGSEVSYGELTAINPITSNLWNGFSDDRITELVGKLWREEVKLDDLGARDLVRFDLGTCAIILGSIVLIYETSVAAADVNQSTRSMRCWFPKNAYALGVLEMHDINGIDNGKFFGVHSLGNFLDSVINESEDLVVYVAGFEPGSLLNFTLTSAFAPSLWTGSLLSQQTYRGWRDSSGADQLFRLNHSLLMDLVMRDIATLTTDTETGPFKTTYRDVGLVQNSMPYDRERFRSIATELTSQLANAVRDFNSVLKKYSDILNNESVHNFIFMEDWGVIESIVYVITFLPALGLILGFTLFVFYMIRKDNQVRTRNVSKRRLRTTGFAAAGYAFYGIFLMLLSGVGLYAAKWAKGVCNVMYEELTSGNAFRSPDANVFASVNNAIVDECLTAKGAGDLMTAFGLTNEIVNLESELQKNDWSFYASQKVTGFDEYQELVNSSHPALPLLLPTIDPKKPELARTLGSIFWSGIQTETVTTDCDDPQSDVETRICKVIKSTHDLGDPAIHPWKNEAYGVIHGLADVGGGLTSLLHEAGCRLKVCVRGDWKCNQADLFIDRSSIGKVSEDYLIDANSNWSVIEDTMPLTRPAIDAFRCIGGSSATIKQHWAVGVHLATLKSLALRPLLRLRNGHSDQTVKEDGFPGFIDMCGAGQRCGVFYSLDNGNPNVEARLASYHSFRSDLMRDTKIAIDAVQQDNFTALVDKNTKVYNPFHTIGTTLADQYNCRAIHVLATNLAEVICTTAFPAYTNLMFLWFMMSVTHFLVFVIFYVYWYCRHRTLEEVASPPAETEMQGRALDEDPALFS